MEGFVVHFEFFAFFLVYKFEALEQLAYSSMKSVADGGFHEIAYIFFKAPFLRYKIVRYGSIDEVILLIGRVRWISFQVLALN